MFKNQSSFAIDSAMSTRHGAEMLNEIFFLFLLLVVPVTSQISLNDVRDNLTISNVDEVIQRTLQSIYPINLVSTLPEISNEILANTSDPRCVKQMELFVNETQKGELWALTMIDASSKIPSGVLKGNRIDIGMYDECMEIRQRVDDEDIRGRHCMYQLTLPLGNMQLNETLSICLPAACGPVELKEMVDSAILQISELLQVDIVIPVQATCSSIEMADWTPGGIVTVTGFSLLVMFLVVSTICDTYLRYCNCDEKPNRYLNELRQFSLYANAVRILSTKTTPQTLPTLQGLRFISMCWVILGHEYFLSLLAPTMNAADSFTWSSSWRALYVILAPFSVDTFFTISGFLTAYLFLKEMSTGRTFNIFQYYLHRYIRLTPALAAVLLMMIFIIPRVGSGALWENNINSMANNCRHNWWPMLLYVHNYVDKDHLWCLAHTWYLAVDMHFYWISPLILYPLAKKRNLGLVILALVFIASIAAPAVIAYQNHYTAALGASRDLSTIAGTGQYFYMESHIRGTPYVVGVIFGYLVFSQKESPSIWIKRIGWILTLGTFAFCVFTLRVFQAKDYKYNLPWEVFYVVVSKPFWSFGVAWIIYASVCGFGGPITTLLSFSIYHPLSRLSYGIYLVHFIIELIKINSLRTARYFSDTNLFNEFLSDLLLCMFFGFLVTLVFESPIITLEKLIRGWLAQRSRSLNNARNGEVCGNGKGA